MSFAGNTSSSSGVGLSNAPMDITPALKVEAAGGTARTRCLNITNHPHVRAVIELRDNISATCAVQLFARMGLAANDAVDFAPYGPIVNIPAGAVGTITVYDVTGVVASDVCLRITDTTTPAGVNPAYYRVYLTASAS